MSLDPNRLCSKDATLTCASVEDQDTGVLLRQEAELFAACEAIETVVPENAALKDSFIDRHSTADHFAAQVDAAAASDDPWKVASVLNWLEFFAPHATETLHAALVSIDQATTDEQAAHAALSCRRLLEQLANQLYPAEPDPDSSFAQSRWKNRGRKGVEDRVSASTTNSETNSLKSELSALYRGLDAAVHGQPARPVSQVAAEVSKLVSLLDRVRSLGVPDQADMEHYAEGLSAFLMPVVEPEADGLEST